MSNEATARAMKAQWMRIPDGTRVRLRLEGKDGAIDGLTELVQGKSLNPDHRTQYRVFLGEPSRRLAGEEELLILVDRDGLILMDKKVAVEYRSHLTALLHGAFAEDKFVAAAPR